MFSYIKVIAVIAILAVIAGGYMYVTNLQKDNANLTASLATAEIANRTLVTERENLKTSLVNSKAEQDKLNDNLTLAREQMNRMTRLFADHDFTNLATKKPGLITIRMKKATDKIFKEIEQESLK